MACLRSLCRIPCLVNLGTKVTSLNFLIYLFIAKCQMVQNTLEYFQLRFFITQFKLMKKCVRKSLCGLGNQCMLSFKYSSHGRFILFLLCLAQKLVGLACVDGGRFTFRLTFSFFHSGIVRYFSFFLIILLVFFIICIRGVLLFICTVAILTICKVYHRKSKRLWVSLN